MIAMMKCEGEKMKKREIIGIKDDRRYCVYYENGVLCEQDQVRAKDVAAYFVDCYAFHSGGEASATQTQAYICGKEIAVNLGRLHCIWQCI